MSPDIHELVVIGSGPGGYAAAFRAADLGIKVTLIEKDTQLGGVCLNRGCIPSKALLHVSKILNETKKVSEIGVTFKSPNIDVRKINSWKDEIIKNLSSGIEGLAKRRNVNIINGRAKFTSATSLIIQNQNKEESINFKYCIVATGSRSSSIPNIKIDNDSIITSKDALNFNSIPEKMLIIGGGYIGLEMATFYKSVGTEIDIAEFLPTILSDMDSDLVSVLNKRIDDNRLMPSTYILDNIRNCISSENYSELLLFIISSLEDKKWTDLHPEHLRLILEGIKKYKDGKIFNKIIMEIISENNII